MNNCYMMLNIAFHTRQLKFGTAANTKFNTFQLMWKGYNFFKH